jgi:hypothetical protein
MSGITEISAIGGETRDGSISGLRDEFRVASAMIEKTRPPPMPLARSEPIEAHVTLKPEQRDLSIGILESRLALKGRVIIIEPLIFKSRFTSDPTSIRVFPALDHVSDLKSIFINKHSFLGKSIPLHMHSNPSRARLEIQRALARMSRVT